MVTKTALILLFLAMPVMGQVPRDDTLWSSVGTSRDTTRYYVFDVKERTKCDTFTVTLPCPDPSYAAQGMSCLQYHYRTVIECDDTTWAPKIQIWLTPIELEQLMKLIRK